MLAKLNQLGETYDLNIILGPCDGGFCLELYDANTDELLIGARGKTVLECIKNIQEAILVQETHDGEGPIS